MLAKFIQNVLFPDRIKNYYIVSKRVVGIDIAKSSVRATRILYKGNSIVIEKCINQPIDVDLAIPYAIRSTQALALALDAIRPYDIIRNSLPASSIVFKELTLPFDDPEKIFKTLQFELEAALPFNNSQTEFSFITTAHNSTNHSTTVMAAATPKTTVEEQKNIFSQAGAHLSVLSVDMFDLYALFQAFYTEKATGSFVVIHMDSYITRIIFIVDGQLKLSRLLTKGLTAIAKSVAHLLDITPSHAMESIIRFGCQDTGKHGYCQAVEDALQEFLKDIQFTISSFGNQIIGAPFPQKIFLLGPGAEPINIVPFAEKILGIPCSLIEPSQLSNNPLIKIEPHSNLDQEVILSTGAALLLPIVQEVNLNTDYQQQYSKRLLQKQLITALGLMAIIFGIIGFTYWWQTSQWKKSIRLNEASIVKALRNENLTESFNSNKALEEAQESVRKQEEVWFSFSAQTRFSFLKYLQALSTAIDRIGIGLKLQRLLINQKDGILTLTGQVRDFDALKQLERSLKESNLFLNIPSLQTTKFNIPIPLKNGIQE